MHVYNKNVVIIFLLSEKPSIMPLSTIPGISEGIVTRQTCQKGFSDYGSTSHDIKVKSYGGHTA